MRLSRLLLALLFVVSLAALGRSQDGVRDDPLKKLDEPAKKFKLPPLKFTSRPRVGFEPYERSGSSWYKPGFWTPVHVPLLAGDKDVVDGRLVLTTNDNEDVNTSTSTRIDLDKTLTQADVRKNTKTYVSYVMPGNWNADVQVAVKALDQTFATEEGSLSLQGKVDLTAQLYLTIPTRIQGLRDALLFMSRQEVQADQNGGQPGVMIPGVPQVKLPEDGPGIPGANPAIPLEDADETSTWPRRAAFETDVALLPNSWLGYHGVDTIILTTGKKEFLEALLQANDRLEAISQWVRLGGHLVVSVAPDKQDLVSALLQSPAWKPALPVKLPADAGNVLANAPDRLLTVEQWAGVSNTPFRSKGAKVPIAQLRSPQGPAPDWEVLAFDNANSDNPRPVITRASYGRGQILFVAFALDQAPFTQWKGNMKFWKRLVEEVSPRLAPAEGKPAPGIPLRRGARRQQNNPWGVDEYGPEADLVSALHRDLDNFNVKIVPFGWVALFIFIYILVVGPLDYLLLKFVFKRLELTWITFPVVVFAVSFAAYFTAYAIKGKELRINQVDLLDFDLRTQIDTNDHKAKAFVYGQSFFTLLSPHIHNYTIGLEPNPALWGQSLPRPLSADMITWLPRGGWRGTGINSRGRQGFLHNPYFYTGDIVTHDEVGLERVLIPVWTTKAFTATWNAELPQMPFQADLVYHDPKKEILVTGKLSSNLEVDLQDVWLIYRNEAYPLNDTLQGKRAGELEVSLDSGAVQKKKDLKTWATMLDKNDIARQALPDRGAYNPTGTIKKILFYENADPSNDLHNQWLRQLDYSWRCQKEDKKEGGIRDAILYARVRFRAGEIDGLTNEPNNPMPANIWLGDLPSRPNAQRPSLAGGNMNQDTYIRVLLPVRPAKQ